MSYSYPDNLFPFPIWLILLLLFYIALAIGMSIEAIIGIIAILVMVIIALWGGFYQIFLKKRLDELDKKKKIHRKKLVNEVLKKEFQNMNITYDEQEFNISITSLKELEEKKIYKYILQHLDAYKPILNSWDKSSILIEKINSELDELVKFTFNKVGVEIDERHKKGLSHPIHHMTKEAVLNDFEDLSIKTRPSGVYIEISLSGGI